MFEGWRWQYSRQVELFAMVAVVIGNRIPMSGDPVSYDELRKGWRYYTDN